jgi:hypothetical protein
MLIAWLGNGKRSDPFEMNRNGGAAVGEASTRHIKRPLVDNAGTLQIALAQEGGDRWELGRVAGEGVQQAGEALSRRTRKPSAVGPNTSCPRSSGRSTYLQRPVEIFMKPRRNEEPPPP